MRDLEITLNTQEFRDKLGIKEPVIDYARIERSIAAKLPAAPDEKKIVQKIKKAVLKEIPQPDTMNQHGYTEAGGGGKNIRFLSNGTEVSAHVTEINFDTSLIATYNGNGRVTVSAGVSSLPLAYDISSQFNGSTTTFTVPAYSSILLFNITGWPPNGLLRQTTDFTTPDNTHISLTSQVAAPVAGTTGIVLYVPA